MKRRLSMADEKVAYTLGIGEALLHNASVMLAQTAVWICILARLRGEPNPERTEAIKQANEWLIEARSLLRQDIGTRVELPKSQ
jgi:hypothetical protein